MVVANQHCGKHLVQTFTSQNCFPLDAWTVSVNVVAVIVVVSVFVVIVVVVIFVAVAVAFVQSVLTFNLSPSSITALSTLSVSKHKRASFP